MPYEITPEEVSHGRSIPDRDLPMVAAHWLVDGFDSPLLRELASFSREEALEGRVQLRDVLAELGFPELKDDYQDLWIPWRGHWWSIAWAVAEMDQKLSPYAAAQRVLEVIGDWPGLWEPGGGANLMGLIRAWDNQPAERAVIEASMRSHLRALNADQVPAER